MEIGVVSDLHGHFHARLPEVFAGCERILCAGDVEREDILWQLETIAPVVAVRGNNDWRLSAPLSSTIQLAGVNFYLVHILARAHDIPADADVVIHGHLHIPSDEVRNGIRYLNPGSTAYPRGGSFPSCMVIEAVDGRVLNVELINLS